MKENYKVSVIIPIYNTEKYLDKCIESVKKQTLTDIQIILINDGSTDGSAEKCNTWVEKYKDIIFINKINEGQAKARNIGLKESKGEYIFFLDSDDFLPENALEIMYNKIKDKNYSTICGTSVSIFKDGRKESNSNLLNKCGFCGSGKEAIIQSKYKDIQPMVWLYLYKKEFLEKYNIKFSEGLYHEDCEFTLKVFYYAEKVLFIEDVIYYQFISDNSTMRSKNFKKSKDAIQIAKNIEEFIINEVKEKNIKRILKKYVSYLYSYSLNYAIQIDEDINKLYSTKKEKRHIEKGLAHNKKYYILEMALMTSNIKLYKKIYDIYTKKRR